MAGRTQRTCNAQRNLTTWWISLIYDRSSSISLQRAIALYQILAIFSANDDISGSQLTDSGLSRISVTVWVGKYGLGDSVDRSTIPTAPQLQYIPPSFRSLGYHY